MTDEVPGRRSYEVGVESRRKILDAAEELIAERGFEKTSIVEISKRSGVSRGSIPWHFDNKDGVLLALVERVTDRHLALDDLSPEDWSLETLFARYADLTRASGARLVLATLNQAVNATGPAREQYQEFYVGERAKISDWLALVGVPAADREPLAGAILSGLLGSTLQWLVDPEGVDVDAVLRSLAAMIESHLSTS